MPHPNLVEALRTHAHDDMGDVDAEHCHIASIAADELERRGELMTKAAEEIDLLRRVIYKLQVPVNVGMYPTDFLNADEVTAYKQAVAESI